MLNQKQIASGQAPVAGQVWYSEEAKNYYRVDEVLDGSVKVQRVAYEFESAIYNGRQTDTYYWSPNTFTLSNFRVVATNLTRFNSWLSRVTATNHS